MRWLAFGALMTALGAGACAGEGSGDCGPRDCPGCCLHGVCTYERLSTGYCGAPGAGCDTWLPCPSGQLCDTVRGSCTDRCDSSTCRGCCVDGHCRDGTEKSYCGVGGGPCLTCTGDQTCAQGSCQGDTACGLGTCAGCCRGNQCMPGSDPSSCGQGGGPCTSCVFPAACVGGSCKGSLACSSADCPTGCCYQGICQRGDSAGMCGNKGAACLDCTITGQVCDAAAKQCVTGRCGPSGPGACAGCCDASGKCALPGTNHSACGGGGAGCANCAAADQLCDAPTRTCVAKPPPPNCGPGNCTGCCEANGCAPSPVPPRCGTGGATCITCATGQECAAGQCRCTAASCTGCCQNDNCVAGTSNPTCGSGGAACTACKGSDVCDPSTRKCKPGQPACGPSSGCNGANCCSSTGNCVAGSASTACGASGNSCADCTLFGQVCSAAQCVAPSNCGSCTGVVGQCCGSSGTCQSGNQDTHCGTVGGICVDCTASAPFPPMECKSYRCEASATSKWKVILGWATFDKGWAVGWGKTMPDSRVTVWASGQQASSYTALQDWQPTWDQQLLSNITAGSLMGPPDSFHQTGFGFHVEQVGTFWNDDVAMCLVSIPTEALYAARSGYYWCFYDCTASSPSGQYFNKDMIEEVCFQFLPM